MKVVKKEAVALEGQFVVFPRDYDKVVKKVARLNKKAAKRGAAPATIAKVREVALTIYEDTDDVLTETNEKVLVFVVEPQGELFKMRDFNLVATLEHTPAGNIIRKAPGFENVDTTKYRNVKGHCEHCETTRARKDTFVVMGPKGTMQVGRNCLADFLRDDEVAGLITAADVIGALKEADEESEYTGGYGGEAFDGYGLQVFLATAYREVKRKGFRPTSFDYSTKQAVLFALNRCPKDREGIKEWEAAQPKAEDFEGAKEVMEFVATMTGDSDYVHNLKIAFARGFVGGRSTGLVASAPGVMMKNEDQKRERKAKKDEHFGEVKKRYELELEVVRTISFETFYGTTEILIMEDQEGRAFVWKTSPTTFERGDKVRGKGTVKDHDTYKDRKQTVLSRCKFEVIKEEAA